VSRLRTIKPEFWSDPVVLSCKRDSRLLFIGIWNFCDDQANIEASPFQIKCLVFPADNINIEPLLKDLEELKMIPGSDIKKRLLIKYKVDGTEYYHVPGFLKHQRIDHPSKPRCPAYSPELAITPQAQDGELFNQPPGEPPPDKKPTNNLLLGEHENVKLTKEEHAKLKALVMPNQLELYIENLSDYIKSKGKQYKG